MITKSAYIYETLPNKITDVLTSLKHEKSMADFP